MKKDKQDFTCEDYAKLTLIANKLFIDYQIVRNYEGNNWQIKATMEDGFEIWKIGYDEYEKAMFDALLEAQARYLKNKK